MWRNQARLAFAVAVTRDARDGELSDEMLAAEYEYLSAYFDHIDTLEDLADPQLEREAVD